MYPECGGFWGGFSLSFRIRGAFGGERSARCDPCCRRCVQLPARWLSDKASSVSVLRVPAAPNRERGSAGASVLPRHVPARVGPLVPQQRVRSKEPPRRAAQGRRGLNPNAGGSGPHPAQPGRGRGGPAAGRWARARRPPVIRMQVHRHLPGDHGKGGLGESLSGTTGSRAGKRAAACRL